MDAIMQQPTTFLFCFHLRESMQLLGSVLALSAVYWVYALILADDGAWQTAHPLRITSIALLVLNAVLVHAAVKTGSERNATALLLSFGLMLILLAITFADSHPASCSDADTIDDTPLGSLVAHLLWTSDACLLMTILGWVTLAAGITAGIYVYYMIVCFWRLLRQASEDIRRVRRTINSLPLKRYRREAEGGESGESSSCAICLGDFEDGEEVRLLPCMHEFCKDCIDPWIERQSLAAACPLCKRMLIPRRPNLASSGSQAPVHEGDAEVDAEGGSNESVAEERAPD